MDIAKPELVIFDLDGTLINAYAAIVESFNYAMGITGYPRQSASVIRKAVGWGDESLLRPFVRGKDLKNVLRIYRKHHARSLLRGARIYPGVLKTLKCLKKKGLRLAIDSTSAY